MSQPNTDIALLIIDIQQGLFEKSTPIYMAKELLENITGLAERAHQAGATVFYVQHNDKKALLRGSDGWQLHPQLKPFAGDLHIYKQHGSAFEETELADELQKRGLKRLVVAGLVTHGCVKAACLDARKRGYPVILVKDAHSSFSKDAAHLIDEWNEKLSAEGVELKTAQEVEF